MNTEIWKTIEGTNDQYEVSNFGQVRSFARNNPKLLKPLLQRDHFSILIRVHGVQGRRLVHRLVVENFIGPIPKNMVVDHIDGTPTNNALSNLRVVSQRENIHCGRKLTRKFSVPNVKKVRDGLLVKKGFGPTMYALGLVGTEALAQELYESCTTEDQAKTLQENHVKARNERSIELSNIRRIKQVEANRARRIKQREVIKALRVSEGRTNDQIDAQVEELRKLKRKRPSLNARATFVAQKFIDGKNRYLGSYPTKEEADQVIAFANIKNYQSIRTKNIHTLPAQNNSEGVVYHKTLNQWSAYVVDTQNIPRHVGYFDSEDEAKSNRDFYININM